MRKHMKIILVLCCIVVPVISLLCYIYFPWVSLPTKSLPHTLTLVHNGMPSIERVTLKHYVDGVHVNDYILDLNVEIRYQTSQSYELPQFNEGMVEVDVGLTYEDTSLTMSFEDTHNLYESGLLVYTTEIPESHITIDGFVYYDEYVYLIASGNDKVCYFKEAGSTEWVAETNVPRPERFVREWMGYSPLYYGWKENEWVIVTADGTADW